MREGLNVYYWQKSAGFLQQICAKVDILSIARFEHEGTHSQKLAPLQAADGIFPQAAFSLPDSHAMDSFIGFPEGGRLGPD